MSKDFLYSHPSVFVKTVAGTKHDSNTKSSHPGAIVRSRFLGGYLASWMLNIHSMNIGHLLNHSYFIKCRRAVEDRWRYRVLEDEEGRYPPSHFLITLILNHQSVNCVTSPMTLRCQSTLVFGYEQIWKRGL